MKILGIILLVIVLIPLLACAALAGVLEGQWLACSIRGHGVEFRRNLLAFYKQKIWPARAAYITKILLLLALIRPITSWPTKAADFIDVTLPSIAVGIIVGFGLGWNSKKPTGWTPVIFAAIVGAVLIWLIKRQTNIIPIAAQWGLYGFVLLVVIVNLIKFSRHNSRKPSDLITEVEGLQLDTARSTAGDLLKDGKILLAEPPVKKLKLRNAELDPFGRVGRAAIVNDGLIIGLHDGFEDKDFDPLMPGSETVRSRMMWILIPSDHVEFEKVDRIIGHTETWYRLKESGAQLRLKGRPKKLAEPKWGAQVRRIEESR